MCGVVQNLERSAAGWLRGFDLVRYTTATENEQQFCPDRIRFHLFSNLLIPNADGEIIPSTTPLHANRNFDNRLQHFTGPPGESLTKNVFPGG